MGLRYDSAGAARTRDEDGALWFEDWGVWAGCPCPPVDQLRECHRGNDIHAAAARRGAWSNGQAWLWPDPAERVIVIRPSDTPMIAVLNQLSARQQRGPCPMPGHPPDGSDWHVSVARWRELRAAAPRLAALKAAAIARNRLVNARHYEVHEVDQRGVAVLVCYTPPSPAFAGLARETGARLADRLVVDRTGWWIAADAPGAPAFRALVEERRRLADRRAIGAIAADALRTMIGPPLR